MFKLHRDWVAGTLLLVTGVLLLGTRLFPDLVPVVPLVVGLAILGWFFLTRSPGALVAGSVIIGIGIGVLIAQGSDSTVGAGGVLVSLAAGFFLAWILGLIFSVRSLRWWPIVPGVILLVIGLLVLGTGTGRNVLDVALDWWPALLVLVGVWLLFKARLHTHEEVSDETTAVPVSREPPPIESPENEPSPIIHDELPLIRDRGTAALSLASDERADEDAHAPALHEPGEHDEAKVSSLEPPSPPVEPNRASPPAYPVRPSTHSLADAQGGHVGGDRPGSVEPL